MPFMMKAGEAWTQEMRNAQVDILQTALKLERRAVSEIGEALVAMEV